MSTGVWIVLVLGISVSVALIIDYLDETKTKRRIAQFRRDMERVQQDEEK